MSCYDENTCTPCGCFNRTAKSLTSFLWCSTWSIMARDPSIKRVLTSSIFPCYEFYNGCEVNCCCFCLHLPCYKSDKWNLCLPLYAVRTEVVTKLAKPHINDENLYRVQKGMLKMVTTYSCCGCQSVLVGENNYIPHNYKDLIQKADVPPPITMV